MYVQLVVSNSTKRDISGRIQRSFNNHVTTTCLHCIIIISSAAATAAAATFIWES